MNAKKIVHWLLLAAIILYLVTGLGITEYRTVEPLTLGVLGKALSQQIHNYLLIPFVILLLLHVAIVLNDARNRKPRA